MTMKEFASAWVDFVEKKNGEPITDEDRNNFCNFHATSYEEYMAMWEILDDMKGEE